MATLVLSAAGSAVGGILGPVGGMLGRAAGAIAGNMFDQRLFGDNSTRVVGYMEDLSVQTGSEGNPIPRIYGRMRLAGTVIWAPDFIEHVDTNRVGGKGGGGPKVREYTYSANFAVGICEGVIGRIGRVWADGEPLDLAKVTHRVYTGTEDQPCDPLIEGWEGEAPAFRGLAYVVFEGLPLGAYGNRLPQLTFEVVRPIGELERQVRAVTLIPGATEFGYDPAAVTRELGPGEVVDDNRHLAIGVSDFETSVDELLAICPNLERVALVVAWFGDDLRAQNCTLTPRVEAPFRPTSIDWQVAGVDRSDARLVSVEDGHPSYGGTPNDASVVNAIQVLRSRGLKVTFYPFILMDVPSGNGLPDPYGAGEQPKHPWRGRITVSPAQGQPGTIDGTGAADAAIGNFVGAAQVSDFAISGESVAYSGSEEWTLRRMILHYAHLCAAAGGVDAFLVGSELRGLSRSRGGAGYPFVDALVALAGDVRGVLGASTKISYAADWSEYFGDHRDGDVSFHLDPFWADQNVDFIGIDNYWPLSDWRDGGHLDADVASEIYDPAYLGGNVGGGEGFDWYYASSADRDAQVRTPVADGAYGKDWVYRYKDLAGWWSNAHFDRVNGVEVQNATAWVPGMKPVWFTEVGCPAIDRGSNQPNVFYDAKSSESALPYYSHGRRDDGIQRAYLSAMIDAFDPARGANAEQLNPVSAVYGGRMLDLSATHVWTWDARPWPAFPHRTDVWSDGENWARGHWVSGRFGSAPVGELIETMFADWGLEKPEVTVRGTVIDGFMVPGSTSLRDALDPLLTAASVMATDTGVGVRFSGPAPASSMTLTTDDMVDDADAIVRETRLEAASLPVEQRLRYFDSGREYRVAGARHLPVAASERQIEEISLNGSMNDGLAAELADTALQLRWAARTTLSFGVPPSLIALQPGDAVDLVDDDGARSVVLDTIEDAGARAVAGHTVDRSVLVPAEVVASYQSPATVAAVAPPVVRVADLPILDESVAAYVPWLATFSRPWPGTMGIWTAQSGGALTYERAVERPATMGEVVEPAPVGPSSRWHDGGAMTVRLYGGSLASADEVDLLAGANALAVQADDGEWEVLQFRDAELVAERTYRLSPLLRGVLGTEGRIAAGQSVGAAVLVLDGTLAQWPIARSALGLAKTVRAGPAADGVGGDRTTTITATPKGRGLVPYAPVHGSARRSGVGDVEIRFVRRTRIGGDSWLDAEDVPLSEESERYSIDILNGSTVVRTLSVTSPSAVYLAADEVADFGAAQQSLSVCIRQVAPGFGPGEPYEVTLNVD
mgnify:CR=1 FL=1